MKDLHAIFQFPALKVNIPPTPPENLSCTYTVQRPKLVSPLTNAMCLVDHKTRQITPLRHRTQSTEHLLDVSAEVTSIL